MNEKIKTSEEIREELANKKVAKTYLSEFENGINQKLSRFEGVLASFKPTYEIKHNYNTDEIKVLKNTLNEINLKLQKISIPEKIEVLEKKETKIVFNDKTTKFLMWFCGISFFIAVAGAVYGINAFKEIEALKKSEFEKGVFKGRNQIYNISTKKSQNLIDKNYPDWNTKIE